MCGLSKVIGVLACLLLIPATPQAQQDRRTGSGAKCKNPKGLEGDIYNDYCTQFTCTKAKGKSGIWVDRPNIDDCCFNQGKGYQMGDVINVTVTNCTETSLVCERREGLATVVACSVCTCFQEILTKLDENGHKIDNIKTEVIENGENIQQIIGDIQEGECEDTECQLENTYLHGRESSLVGGGGVQDIQSWCECQQLCAGNSECESFTWNYMNNSVCYLLSDVPDETGTKQGASSGIKTCWAPSNSQVCYNVTEDKYNGYNGHFYRTTNSSLLTFNAQGSNDVHVLVSLCDGSCNGFEILIGGWSNSYSSIRAYRNENATKTETPSILSATEKRTFWIKISKEGDGLTIEVGKGGETIGFMARSWTSNPYSYWPPLPTNPYSSWPLLYVAFGAWASQVDYDFCLNEPACPTGWTRFQGACYKLYKEIKTWADARAFCLTQQADLVSVHSQREEDLVKQLGDGYDTIWLGGMDIENDGQWEWSDGTPWDYKNWQPGQPSGGGGRVDLDGNGWNDINSDFTGHTKGFICKK